MISNAVGSERISRILGYKIEKGDFSETSPNLPQRVAVLGEANTSNQGSLDLTPWRMTSAQATGLRYGFGSPLYHVARILFPLSGGGSIGGIPVWVYPQATAEGDSKIVELTPLGTATKSGVHTVLISGRGGLDGKFYDINISKGDTPSNITDKIADAVNAVLGSPVIADDYDPSKVVFETKWKGLTADGLEVSINTNDDDLGITYATATTQSGQGTPSIQAALNLFGNNWNTIVVNTYGLQSTVMNTLESFNGIPDPTNPTGRFAAILLKPFVALSGSVLSDPSSLTDGRLNDVSIAVCPAPLSKGFQFEAAANMCSLLARVAQDTPHLDVSGMSYPDMPTPDSIGVMSVYDNRDIIVQKGCSTVDLVGGKYQIQELVTTYHPLGETPPQYRYVRSLYLQDMNVYYGCRLLELLYLIDHAIAGDDDVVTATKVVKPKEWKGILNKYADDLAERAIITEPEFMQDSLTVAKSTTNPDRMETFFRYKRTGFARIVSTTAQAGFSFGTL
jgi:phage tail sheath gpL-like